MSKRINKLFYFMTAMIASNFVNAVYEFKSAFAISIVCSRVVSTVYNNNYCQSGNYLYPNSGSKCGTDWRSLCRSGAGWTCAGQIYNASSGYCQCSSLTYYTMYAREEIGKCGTVYKCGSGADERGITAMCNTGSMGGPAGYIENIGLAGGQACHCCPTAIVDRGSVTVFSKLDAQAASDCYVVGQLSDDTGLYEYTDADRCYYAS